MNFGTSHGVNAIHFPQGQRVVVKVEGLEVDGTVVHHDGRHGVEVKLDHPVIVKTITVTKRLFRKDVVEIGVERFDQSSFFETNVGVVKGSKVHFFTIHGFPAS